MANELKKEIKQIGADVNIYNTTESFLNNIKLDVQGIDRGNLNKRLKTYLINHLKSDEMFEDLVFKDIKDSKISLFLTENTNVISVSFTVDLEAVEMVVTKCLQ